MLTVRDTMALDLEDQRFKYAGAKDAAIRDTLGWSPTRHYQVINDLIDRREALEHNPILVRRLLRLREQRQRARAVA